MLTYRVYYELDGKRDIKLVTCYSAEEAANEARKELGCIVIKVKVDRTKPGSELMHAHKQELVSQTPFYDPELAKSITETAQQMLRDIQGLKLTRYSRTIKREE